MGASRSEAHKPFLDNYPRLRGFAKGSDVLFSSLRLSMARQERTGRPNAATRQTCPGPTGAALLRRLGSGIPLGIGIRSTVSETGSIHISWPSANTSRYRPSKHRSRPAAAQRAALSCCCDFSFRAFALHEKEHDARRWGLTTTTRMCTLRTHDGGVL